MSLGVASRHHSAEAEASLREATTLDVIDAALGRAAHRSLFTRDEVLALFEGIRAGVGDGGSENIVATITAALVEGDEQMADAARVTDALLDIRLALRHAEV